MHDLVAAIPLSGFQSDHGIVTLSSQGSRDEKLHIIVKEADHDQVARELVEYACEHGG